jgi:hypothetical protein
MKEMSATDVNRRTGDLFAALTGGEVVRLMYGPLVAGYAIPPEQWTEYQALLRERLTKDQGK